MSATTKIEDRVVVPAWYKSFEAGISPEFTALKDNNSLFSHVNNSINELYNEFKLYPDLGKAIELLNTAYIQGNSDYAIIAARFIITSQNKLPLTLMEFSQRVIDGVNSNPEQKHINNNELICYIKKWLKNNPSDCISWIDLSRLYMSLGQINAAERSMIIGLNLSNKNRWVTRVASRFFYNIDEYDRAHHILLRHPNIKVDPWLLSAELAITSGADISPRHWNNAKRALELGYETYHITELQSSLATLELKSGALKKAKKLFINSLIHPNSNVLAQAKWAEKKCNIKELVTDNVLNNQSKAFEAKFLDAYNKQHMEKALEFGKKWIKEEPFNALPAIKTSYVAALLDLYEEAKEISENGLIINNHNETLQLNLIFSKIALANIDNIKHENNFLEDDSLYLEKMLRSDDQIIVGHALANLGLIYYRRGEIEKGKLSYEQSINILKTVSYSSAVFAEINHLRESLIAMAPWGENLFIKLELLSKSGGYWDEPSVSFYLKKLQKIRKDSSNWRVLLTETIEHQSKPLIDDDLLFIPSKDFHFDLSPQNPTIWLPYKK